MIGLADVRAAAERIRGAVLRTPTIPSDAVSRAAGCRVFLKLDTLQATGAFKERGAANRIALPATRERGGGVIAMSAGNHAQAVARHAALAGIPAVIVMPRFTPATKVVRTEGWGARVVLHGDTLAEAAAHAHELARRDGLTFIHPYDDPAVIAGQGTLALEMLEDQPRLDALVLPVGGGGLLAGCAAAARELRPGMPVFGVEVEGYPAMAQRLAGAPVAVGGPTIAEGIAVRDVGEVPLGMIREFGIEVLVVPERAVEQAIALLAEGARVVAEGAGAAGLAAILAFPERFAGKARRHRGVRRQHRFAHPVQRAAAQPAAGRAHPPPAPRHPGPAGRPGRHRRPGSPRPAATSSRCCTSACSPRPRCRARSSS